MYKVSLKKALVVIVMTVMILACSLFTPRNSTANAKAEEQAVYAALLDGAKMAVISEKTAISISSENIDSTLEYVRTNLSSGISADTLTSFKTRNDQYYPLSPDMQLGLEYKLINQQEMQEIFNGSGKGWDTFYERYPDSPGIFTFSRVGFNSSMDEALVYVGNQSNWLAGTGYYVLLKKIAGHWQVKDQIMVWIS